MAATTAQIRAALRTIIVAGIPTGWQVSAYMLSSPTPPSIDIRPAGTVFDRAMGRGLDELHLTVRAMVAFNNDQGAQMVLDQLLDTTSNTGIKTVIEAGRNADGQVTLGGVVQDTNVESVSDYKALIVEGQPSLLAVEFLLLVYP